MQRDDNTIIPPCGRVAAVLEHLAADEADLVSYAAELRMDRDTYRDLSIALIGELHKLTKSVALLRDRLRRAHAVIKIYLGRQGGRPA